MISYMISLFKIIASLFGGIFPPTSFILDKRSEEEGKKSEEESKKSEERSKKEIYQIEFGNQYSIYEEMELLIMNQLSYYTIQMREYENDDYDYENYLINEKSNSAFLIGYLNNGGKYVYLSSLGKEIKSKKIRGKYEPDCGEIAYPNVSQFDYFPFWAECCPPHTDPNFEFWHKRKSYQTRFSTYMNDIKFYIKIDEIVGELMVYSNNNLLYMTNIRYSPNIPIQLITANCEVIVEY